MLLIKILVFILHNKELKHKSSNQERNNAVQVTVHNKSNTNINKINYKSELSVITNSINNFENVINSAMKSTGNMKEIDNKNVDTESIKEIKENP